MHVLTASTLIDLGNAGTIKPGRYLVEDVNGAEILVMAEAGTAFVEYDTQIWTQMLKPFDAANDYNGMRVLFMRSGGFGDMILMGPILREMRRRWPAVKLTVVCRKERHAVFDGLSYAPDWQQTPVSVETAANFDALVSFEHVIERERKLHYVDALAAHMGLTLPDGAEARRIEYQVSTFEKACAGGRYRRKDGKKRLGIQVMSGARYRSYPRNQTGQVAMHFLGEAWEVYLLGVKGDVQEAGKVPGLRDLTNDGLSFRQSVAALATCDVLLAPDSSLLHISAAIGVPAVGLFAAIPSVMRTAYAPSITALDGVGKCAPCFWHVRGGQDYPKAGECTKTGRCEPLARISVESIVKTVEEKVA